MEFSHVGDVLHPSPDDVEAAVRAAGTNTGEEVLEAARRKKMSFVRRQLAPEASRRVDAALSEEFIGAPGWRVEIVQARQVCGGPLWCVSSGGKGLVACGGSDGVVRVATLGTFERAERWRLNRDSALSDVQLLEGHEGAVFDCAFSRQEDKKKTTLVTVSADATARLWTGWEGDPRLSPGLIFAHGQGVCCCAWLGGESFVTGGFDRNIRVWHIPDRKATAWAHLNDAVTAVGCRASDGPGAPARLGVGTRGGQVFVYKSRDHTHVECDEMVLGTMRSGAFNEAERCGAAGIRAHSNALQGVVAGSAKPKKKGGGFFSKLFKPRKKQTDLQAESEARAAEFLSGTDEDTKVEEQDTDSGEDDSSEDGDLQEIEQTDKVASVESVKYRASSISFPREDGLLCCANNGEPALYDAMNPQKDAQTTFRGGVRSVVGCGVSADETGTFCVGGSETGQILAWRLPDVGTSKPEALPLEIDVKARNARIAAVTAVAFVPSESASATLDAKVLKATYDNTGACLIVATDYSGRLLVAQREPGDAHAEGVDTLPTPPPSATKTKKKRPSLPGQAYVEEE